jgi:hypothetical protein
MAYLKAITKVLDGSGNPYIIKKNGSNSYAVMVKFENGLETTYYYVTSRNAQGDLDENASMLGNKYTTVGAVIIPSGWSSTVVVVNCAVALAFLPPIATNIEGNITRFIISTEGNEDQQVQFEYGSGWVDGDTQTSKTFEVPNRVNANDNPIYVNIRIKGCTNSIQGTVRTYEYSGGGGTGGGEVIIGDISYTLSSADNYLNLDQFDDVTPPEQLQFGTGAGFPQFIEDGTGLIKALRKGYAYTVNGSAYGESRIPSSKTSRFTTPDGDGGRLEQVALQVSQLGGVYESAKYIHASNGHQFNLVTNEAANAVGRNYAPATSFKPNNTNCSLNWYSQIGQVFFDSEIYQDGSDWHRVMWNIIKGIKDAQLTIKTLFFYGRYATSFLQGGALSSYYRIGNMTFDNTFLTDWQNNGSYYRWSDYANLMEKTCIDLGQYFRDVIPLTASLYKKDAFGAYIIVGGKRVFRDDTFTETVFGHTNEYLAVPDDEVRYRQKNNTTGAEIVNSILQPGYGWFRGESQYRDPAQYRHAVEWALESVFRIHDLMQDGLRSVTKNQFGTLDVTRYRDWLNTKPAATFCVYTEPFTYGGNHWKRNWATPEMLKWMYLDAVFSGIFNIEMWQDGTGGEYGLTSNTCPEPTSFDSNNNPTGYSTYVIKTQGNALYAPFTSYYAFNNNRWNSIEVVTATVNKIVKLFNGVSFNDTLRFGSFTKAIKSAGDKEVLGKFFYQGTRLVMYLWNPFNDLSDTTSVTVTLGTQTRSISVVGRELRIFEFDISGLGVNNPIDVKLQYNNTDGSLRKVTGDINNHNW